MRRALAVLAAVGMVVVAVLVRDAMDDEASGGGGGDGGDDRRVVICATDLQQACRLLEGVEVQTADPATTAAALAAGTLDDEVDAWITSTAWLEVVESRAPESLGEARAIATSPTVMATAPGRDDAITDLCSGDDIWQCLGGHAGADWGDLGVGSPQWRELKVGVTDPDLAQGLPVLASAAAGYFGTTDFAANDPAFSDFEAWLANLAGPSASGDPNPALTLATRPGTYSAAGAISAIVDDLAERGVDSIEPEVPVDATVAVVELAAGDGLPDTRAVRDALEADGWARADDDDLTPTLKPGVMAALHTLWTAVTT